MNVRRDSDECEVTVRWIRDVIQNDSICNVRR